MAPEEAKLLVPAPSGSSRLIPIVVGVFLFVFAFVFAIEKVYNYDIWWHLSTGEWILRHGQVPRSDPFSFTVPGAAWMPHYWLTDVVFFAMHRATGMEGLILFKALLVGVAFAGLYALMLRDGVNPFVAALLVIVAVAVTRFRFLLRPHVIAFPMTVAVYGLLTTWKGRGDLRLVWLVPLTALWVNLHGSAFLAVVFTGFLLAESLLLCGVERASDRDVDWARAKLPAIVTALVALAMCVSPFGLGTLGWVVDTLVAKSVIRTLEVEEFRRLAWGEHRLYWALMLLAGASFALAARRARILHALLFVGTSLLAVTSIRFIAIAAPIQAAILAHNSKRALDRLGSRGGWLSPRVQAALGIPILLALGLLAFRGTFSEEKVYKFGLGVNESRFPEDAVDFLDRIDPAGNTYNTWDLGGYLLWKRPDRKTFLDRRHLEAQLEFDQRLQAMSAEELRRFFEGLDIRSALVAANDAKSVAHFRRDDAFGLVYFDDQALVFVRDDALEPAEMVKLLPFQLIQPESFDFSYLAHLARSSYASAAEAELRRAVAVAPRSFKAHFMLALFLEASERPHESIREYLDAAKLNPRLAFLHYSVGRRGARLAMRLQMWDEVVSLLEPSVALAPDEEKDFLLGTALYKKGEFAAAELAYQRVLDVRPDSVQTLVNLGFLYIDTERTEAALRAHGRALELHPDEEAALYGLALGLEKSGRRPESAERWREFLSRHPHSPRAQMARAHVDRLTRGEPEAAPATAP
jgi:tetratricopeptide (TPR) repeat protein